MNFLGNLCVQYDLLHPQIYHQHGKPKIFTYSAGPLEVKFDPLSPLVVDIQRDSD